MVKSMCPLSSWAHWAAAWASQNVTNAILGLWPTHVGRNTSCSWSMSAPNSCSHIRMSGLMTSGRKPPTNTFRGSREAIIAKLWKSKKPMSHNTGLSQGGMHTEDESTPPSWGEKESTPHLRGAPFPKDNALRGGGKMDRAFFWYIYIYIYFLLYI